MFHDVPVPRFGTKFPERGTCPCSRTPAAKGRSTSRPSSQENPNLPRGNSDKLPTLFVNSSPQIFCKHVWCIFLTWGSHHHPTRRPSSSPLASVHPQADMLSEAKPSFAHPKSSPASLPPTRDKYGPTLKRPRRRRRHHSQSRLLLVQRQPPLPFPTLPGGRPQSPILLLQCIPPPHSRARIPRGPLFVYGGGLPAQLSAQAADSPRDQRKGEDKRVGA